MAYCGPTVGLLVSVNTGATFRPRDTADYLMLYSALKKLL